MAFVSRDNLDKNGLELGTDFAPKFDEDGLIPVVAQDAATGTVLMVAYMNAEALERTIAKGEAVYWSRSRKKFWHKGEESGNVQRVKEILTDCDQDVVLLRVEQVGDACCHNGFQNCFYRSVTTDGKAGDSSGGKLAYNETKQVFDPKDVYGK